MVDFVADYWSWIISGATLVSILVLVVFTMRVGRVPPGVNPQDTTHVWDEDLAEYNHPLPRWWLNLFYITLAFGAVYLVLYPGLGSFAGLFGWTQITQYREEVAAAEKLFGPLFDQYANRDLVAVSGDPKAVQIGKRLFASYCTSCHGADGGGARGYPNLRDTDWLHGGEPAAIETSIKEGRSGNMPPWTDTLGNEGVFNVAQYVLSLSGRTVDAGVAEQGKAIFMERCAMCHGAEGRGNTILGAPNLADAVWIYGGSPERVTESIARGRQNTMPAHGEFLGAAKVHLLAAYVYSLTQGSESQSAAAQP